jgi:hypothetical protein
MIRVRRRPARGPAYQQKASSGAAARAASVIPKHMAAVVRPIYGFGAMRNSTIRRLAKFARSKGKNGFAVVKKASGTRFRMGLVALALFALAYAVETKAVLILESSQDLFEVMR